MSFKCEEELLEALKFSEDDLLIQKKVLQEKRQKIAETVKKQSLLYLRLDKARTSNGLFFDDIEDVDRKRNFSKRFS